MKKKTGRKAWTKRKEFRKVRTCTSCGRVLTKRGDLCYTCEHPPKKKNTHCIDCKNPLPRHNRYRGDLRCRDCEMKKRNENLASVTEQAINLYEAGFSEPEICTLVNRSWKRVRCYIRTKYPLYKKLHPASLTHKDYVEKVRKLREDGLSDIQILSKYPGMKIKKALIALNMEKYYNGEKENSSPTKRIRLKKDNR